MQVQRLDTQRSPIRSALPLSGLNRGQDACKSSLVPRLPKRFLSFSLLPPPSARRRHVKGEMIAGLSNTTLPR